MCPLNVKSHVTKYDNKITRTETFASETDRIMYARSVRACVCVCACFSGRCVFACDCKPGAIAWVCICIAGWCECVYFYERTWCVWNNSLQQILSDALTQTFQNVHIIYVHPCTSLPTSTSPQATPKRAMYRGMGNRNRNRTIRIWSCCCCCCCCWTAAAIRHESAYIASQNAQPRNICKANKFRQKLLSYTDWCAFGANVRACDGGYLISRNASHPIASFTLCNVGCLIRELKLSGVPLTTEDIDGWLRRIQTLPTDTTT